MTSKNKTKAVLMSASAAMAAVTEDAAKVGGMFANIAGSRDGIDAARKAIEQHAETIKTLEAATLHARPATATVLLNLLVANAYKVERRTREDAGKVIEVRVIDAKSAAGLALATALDAYLSQVPGNRTNAIKTHFQKCKAMALDTLEADPKARKVTLTEPVADTKAKEASKTREIKRVAANANVQQHEAAFVAAFTAWRGADAKTAAAENYRKAMMEAADKWLPARSAAIAAADKAKKA